MTCLYLALSALGLGTVKGNMIHVHIKELAYGAPKHFAPLGLPNSHITMPWDILNL